MTESRSHNGRAGSPDPASQAKQGGVRRPRPATSRPGFPRWWLVCASVAACGFLVTACSRNRSAATEETTLRLSQRNEPSTLDPQVASLPDEFFILRALSEGLVRPVPEGVAVPPSGVLPAAAEHWEASRDGREWTFHLRPDARWSNGDPVTAGDFVATIRRALNPALAAPKAPLFFVLRNAEAYYRGTVADVRQVGATARDDHTLVLALEHPAPQLLALAASGPWLPVHAATVARFGDARDSAWTRPGHFVGNGPFVLSEWRPHEVIVVTRNPLYHDAARVRVGRIRFQVYDNENTEELAFRAGQVDVTMAIPVSRLGAYAPPVRRVQPLAETRYLALNVRRPPLDDPRVRRALSLALDRSALVEAVLKGGQTPALTFIPPGLGGYSPGGLPEARGAPEAEPAAALPRRAAGFRPDEARRLLAEAGFPDGRNFPPLEISTWTNATVLEAVQGMWRRELGIDVSIALREAKVHAAALRTGDFAVGFVPAIPDYGDASALFDDFITGAPGNYPRWSSPRYDELVGEAARTTTPARRLAVERKAEQILLADGLVIPLYFNAQNLLVAPRVSHWLTDRLWNRCYLDVSVLP